MSAGGWTVVDDDPSPFRFCECCLTAWDWPSAPPGGEWAHGVWKSVAALLDAPVQRAFDEHCARHGCTWAATPPQALDSCREAWDLFFITSRGRYAVWIGAAHDR